MLAADRIMLFEVVFFFFLLFQRSGHKIFHNNYNYMILCLGAVSVVFLLHVLCEVSVGVEKEEGRRHCPLA